MKIFGLNITRSTNAVRNLGKNEGLLTESSTNLKMPAAFDRSSIDNFPVDDFTFQFLDTQSFNSLWSISSERTQLYQSFDEMARDSIIAAALEMYADDATQYDANGRVIWVESEDPDLASKLNHRLSVLGIDRQAWTIYYMLAKFGEVYIRQYKYRETVADERSQILPDKEVIKFEDYVEVVKDPENYYDLVRKGKTERFARVTEIVDGPHGGNTRKRTELYPPDQFIHILLDKPDSRNNRNYTLSVEDPETGELVSYEYDIREGKSMLQDIYGIQRQINLLENSLILNRLSKSAITRVVSVEVGDMPAPQVSATLRRVKSALENKVSFDSNAGMTNYNAASGLDNIVVSPTREGKGAITTEVIGGDVDVKSILDIDYFNNKRFGGLKIPKAFLGYEEALGNNGGGTLTKQDIRYGRTIKRLQTSVVSGITTLLTIWLKSQGYSGTDLTNFRVKVVSPTTDQDEETDTRMKAQFDTANSIMDLVGDLDVDKKAILGYLFSNVLDHQELSKILSLPKQDIEDTPDDEDTDNIPEDDYDDPIDTDEVSDSSNSDDFLANDPDEDNDTPIVSDNTATVTVPSQAPAID